jgi:hypothetical protein
MTLPKFLLAWSDFNWLWLYVRLRPAKTARWSVLRTLLLSLSSGSLGAVLGLLVGLVLFREPVGWLPWLLGLMGFCVGLCWFGVTGLCWNQRAAQLRAVPALPTGLSEARYPFFRWCLGFVYLLILGGITPFALVVTVENIRAEIVWKRERARLAAAGEKLTTREILGPEIAAAQNSGAAPVFAPFFDYYFGVPTMIRGEDGGGGYASGLVWRQSNELARIERVFRTPANYQTEASKGSSKNPTTPKVNVAEWSAAFRKAVSQPEKDDTQWANEIKLPTPGDPARDVLAGLSVGDRELAEVCAGAALPRSQFPLHYDETMETLLRHLSAMKGVQQVLHLRCAAHLAAGEADNAFADATNALNVADLLREEPLMISQLVRYAQINIAVSTVWQGLADHRWNDAQLAEFQRRLARFDCAPSIVLALEGERSCFVIAGMDRIINDPRVYDSVMGPPPGILRVLRMIPRSVLRHNQTTMAHYQTEALVHLRQAISNTPQTGLITAVQSREAKLEHYIPRAYSPYTAMFAMLAPATGKAINKTARAETVVKLAIAACALERYRLAQGEYPERLEQLAPKFATSAPFDPMVSRPFRYQRTDDGWFLLYSVGLNGKDDGGLMRSEDKSDKEEKDWPWPVPTRPEHPRLF